MAATARTKTFRSGNSVAVRLPAAVSPGLGVEMTIEKSGDCITLRPVRENNIDELLAKLRALPRPTTPWVVERISWPRRPWLPEDSEDASEEEA